MNFLLQDLEHQDVQKDLQVLRLGFSGLVHRTVSGSSRRRRRRPRVRQDRPPQLEVRRRIRFVSTSQYFNQVSSFRDKLSCGCSTAVKHMPAEKYSLSSWVRFPLGAGLLFHLFLSLSGVSLIRSVKKVHHCCFFLKNESFSAWGKAIKICTDMAKKSFTGKTCKKADKTANKY